MSKLLKVLLVEDNPGDAELLKYLLNEAGVQFEIVTVARLSTAIAEINADSFDVILLDLGLPDSYGLDTLITLLEIEPAAPVIVLTGLADEAVGTEAVKSGAQDYLIKGQIDKNLLARSIRHSIERKRSAEAIKAAAREWSASFDAMADGVSIHSLDHTILNANQSLYQLLGKSADEVIGKKCYQVFHQNVCPAAGCSACRMLDTNRRAFSEMFEPVLDKWLSVSVSPVFDDFGRMLKIVHTVRDITEHRKLEVQLRHSQKLESIGTLAGGIAHDFNNILTVIIGFGNLALMDKTDAASQRHNIQQMLEAADRATNLTREMLLFSRKQPTDKKTVDLNGVVTRVEKFLNKIIGEEIVYKTVLNEAPLPVLADKYQLEQVLMNLVTNARDSMPRGGALTVIAEYVTLDVGFVNTRGYGKPGSYALITVADTGVGMDEATRQRIFEPFFTTKEVGKGTGLGLAVVYGIIKQHEGYINVYSEPGMGTTFKIYLPVIAEAIGEERLSVQEEAPVGGSETILLAEDDVMVRQLEMMVLQESGYTVIAAENGAEAVRKFKENESVIDLLLLDLIMPGMNGKEAYDEIRKIRPGVKAIFTSGYTHDTLLHKVSLEEGVHLVGKPLFPSELLRKVRSVLDAVH